MSGDKGSSKTDTLVKVVLVFFISLLSFSVGTFVGKQVSDSDHRRLALEGEYRADRSVASHDEGAEAESKISEKEVESLTEEFVNKEKAGREPAEAADHDTAAPAEHHAAPAEHAAPASKEGYKSYPKKGEAVAKDVAAKAETIKAEAVTKGEAVKADAGKKLEAASAKATKVETKVMAKVDGASKAADKVAEGKAPTDGAKEERKPQAALPSVASSAVGKYTVQVASYLSEGEAKTHAADLKGKGWQAFYLTANVHGKTYFRVLVGLFDSQGSASTFRAQFMKEAKTNNALVQKIVQ